jgi:hypothetical protein
MAGKSSMTFEHGRSERTNTYFDVRQSYFGGLSNKNGEQERFIAKKLRCGQQTDTRKKSRDVYCFNKRAIFSALMKTSGVNSGYLMVFTIWSQTDIDGVQ